MAPLIPYIQLPEIPITPTLELPGAGHLDPITIKPFGTLVALGVWAGWKLAMRQSKRLGMNEEVMNSFVTWVVGIGFVGGHVFDVILYHPDKVLHAKNALDAILELVFIWRSQSSFGGFMGAAIGLFIWKHKFKVKSVLQYADTVASAFPLGWVFGRSGCTVAHDHPGMHSDAWFAVNYGSHPPYGGRFDLGLYEMLFTIPLALTFIWLMKKPRPYGFYIGLMCTAYAPTRFAMDFLRAQDVHDADPRHLGLTPAQWLCSFLLAVGVYYLFHAARAAERGETPHYVGEEQAQVGDGPGDGGGDDLAAEEGSHA